MFWEPGGQPIKITLFMERHGKGGDWVELSVLIIVLLLTIAVAQAILAIKK